MGECRRGAPPLPSLSPACHNLRLANRGRLLPDQLAVREALPLTKEPLASRVSHLEPLIRASRLNADAVGGTPATSRTRSKRSMNRRSLLGTAAVLGLFASALTTAAETAAAADTATKRIMLYGDSNTWGFIPIKEGAPSTRYPADVRWPGVLQAKLGNGYEVVVEALNGRTTDLADPTVPQVSGAGLDGAAYLPAAIASHVPLDLVVIMLGTNDLKAMFKRSPLGIALGVGKLVDLVQAAGEVGTNYPAPKVLV